MNKRKVCTDDLYFDLEGKIRLAILPLTPGLVLAESMGDIHNTFREMFQAAYPIVAEGLTFQGFAGRDLAEARYDARFTIPLVSLNVMEECICGEALLPEQTRKDFRGTVEMLRHRIDPRPVPPPQRWSDLELRYFDYDVMALAFRYLAKWSPPNIGSSKRSRYKASTDEIRRREDLVTAWQFHQRKEVEDGRLVWKGLRGDHRPWTIDWLCEEHDIDRGDFGRWRRGELDFLSVKSRRIEVALTVAKGS